LRQIFLQVALIRAVPWLHPTYLILGFLEAWLGWRLRKAELESKWGFSETGGGYLGKTRPILILGAMM
jgi:hypothetical protein